MCWVCYPLLTQHSIKRTYHSQIGNHSLPPLQLPNFMLHVFGIFLSLACLFGAIHTFGRGSLAFQVAPKAYMKQIAVSSLLKSCFFGWTKLNPTGSDQIILALATCGDLDSVSDGRSTLECMRLRGKCQKMTSNERPETLSTLCYRHQLHTWIQLPWVYK